MDYFAENTSKLVTAANRIHFNYSYLLIMKKTSYLLLNLNVLKKRILNQKDITSNKYGNTIKIQLCCVAIGLLAFTNTQVGDSKKSTIK